VLTPQQERDLALAEYRSACVEFDEAQLQWDPYLDANGASELDPDGAEAAFDRLRRANQTRQDALDSLWVAWRNRPDTEANADSRSDR
jgi:hypothetical protein